MQEAGDAIKNKIGQFTANPLIRNIIGQPTSSFDVREFMDEKKILIVNLSKGLIGETNANLLGSMLITRIYLSAMSRADMPAAQLKQMPNFYFYVDEFQSFANEAFANILSEARKYKLNLTIAHQYIEQMEEEVRNAVFGNVGTTIAFRVGPFDAEVLETIFSPEFMATDIVNLGFAQIYLTLMIDGIGSRPFSAVTLPPIPQSKVSFKDIVLAESRQKYARPRAEIEASIAKWHEPLPKPEAPKRESPRPDLKAVLAPHSEQARASRPAQPSYEPRTPRTEAPRPAYARPTEPPPHTQPHAHLHTEVSRQGVPTMPAGTQAPTPAPIPAPTSVPAPAVTEVPLVHHTATSQTPPREASPGVSKEAAAVHGTAEASREPEAYDEQAPVSVPKKVEERSPDPVRTEASTQPRAKMAPRHIRGNEVGAKAAIHERRFDARPPRSAMPPLSSKPPHKHQYMQTPQKKEQHLADLKAVLATLTKPAPEAVKETVHESKPDLRSALQDAMRVRVVEKESTVTTPTTVPPIVTLPVPPPSAPPQPLQTSERTSHEAHANTKVQFAHQHATPDRRAEERKSLEKLERILKGRQ
jgi:hypothetical protein